MTSGEYSCFQDPSAATHRRFRGSKSSIAPCDFQPIPNQCDRHLVSAYGENEFPKAHPLSSSDHTDARATLPLRQFYDIRKHDGHLTERSMNEEPKERGRTLHKKTKSSVSLKSLIRDKSENRQLLKQKSQEKRSKSPKKSRSSANLSIFLPKSRSNKNKQNGRQNASDKENETPPASASLLEDPAWKNVVLDSYSHQVQKTKKVPLNDHQRTVEEEIALYTPKVYSPSKQRDFFQYGPPTLGNRSDQKHKQKSEHSSFMSTSSFMETLSGLRHGAQEARQSLSMRLSSQIDKRKSADEAILKSSRSSKSSKSFQQSSSRKVSRESEASRNTSKESPPNVLIIPKQRGSRVKAVVAALNSKLKDDETTATPLDPKAIDSAFEALLDEQNIPANMREKMRNVDPNIKEDFIKKSRAKSISGQSNSSRPVSAGEHLGENVSESKSFTGALKTRNRSKTFSLGRSEKNSSKKSRSAKSSTHSRGKSYDISVSSTINPKSVASSMVSRAASLAQRSSKMSNPEDFVAYLRKVQKPEVVEVGKLHKLRLLLRNEPVAWVESFINQDGMSEIVGLLNRIMQVEWREEHEDNLLHETLLCLKAMCTTDIALKKLASIESALFPALLHMLFDEEKKGPSEFTTRNIIISLLFLHLSTASPDALPVRARTILSFLHDPAIPDEAKPPSFIADIYQPRPYRVWCKEVVNVSKEVFWIFLHHLNVVPLVETPVPSPTSPQPAYTQVHFPRERPPVPAAPYVGGVEWDATNYLATHLDLLNGLLASLPTTDERNALRDELRASGFEKCMGGSLRTCKEKFYGAVHEGLKTWVAAAAADGWNYDFVMNGPSKEQISPIKPMAKGKSDEPPKLEMPKLDFGTPAKMNDGWL